METIPERLRRIRRTSGLSQPKLAAKAGLSVGAVAAIEQGKRRRPRPQTLRKLSDALGVELSELLEG